MTARAAFAFVRRNLATSRGHLVFSAVGLVVGTATLAFFLALSNGIRENVLNRLYPVNQVEFQVETVRLFGLGVEVPVRLDEASLKALAGLPGVTGVFPKQKSKFQARLWGGREVFGYEARLEAFFDGIAPELVRDEIRTAEEAVLGPPARGGECASDAECGAASRCEKGSCRRETYWDTFRDGGGAVACRGDSECPPGMACTRGLCATPCGEGQGGCRGECVGEECLSACGSDGDCLPGEVCKARGGVMACRRLLCRLDDAKDQFEDGGERPRGRLLPPEVGSGGPGTQRCPKGTYCAAWSATRREGACEAPMPVLLSPFVLEIYNTVAATALGLKRLSGLEVMLGLEFSMLYGESYFVADEEVERRVVRRCRVAGFSRKAMEFGVTVPLPYVVRANAMLRGRDEAAEFTSVVVETARNEDVPALVEDARVLGLTLAPRSEEGRKAANVLGILTIVFGMVSMVILGIAAINITHTFLMLVTERRTEIAVCRAVGASLFDIRIMMLGEAACLGLCGGLGGLVLAFLLSRGANLLAGAFLTHVPGTPSDLFVFSTPVLLSGLGTAILFALVGAYLPARKAARTDPATVLAQG